MPVAVVCAAFDPATDAAVEDLRAEVEAAEQGVRRAHRPHLTLAAARVADVAAVVAIAAAVAGRHDPVPLTMTGFGSFPSGVLFVEPARSTALRDLQRDAHRSLVVAGYPPAFGAQSEPDSWIPHCTLATRVERSRLADLVTRSFSPLPATVDALAVIVVGGRGDAAHFPLRTRPQGPDQRPGPHDTITG
jgi:2'-5' RNA ligase